MKSTEQKFPRLVQRLSALGFFVLKRFFIALVCFEFIFFPIHGARLGLSAAYASTEDGSSASNARDDIYNYLNSDTDSADISSYGSNPGGEECDLTPQQSDFTLDTRGSLNYNFDYQALEGKLGNCDQGDGGNEELQKRLGYVMPALSTLELLGDASIWENEYCLKSFESEEMSAQSMQVLGWTQILLQIAALIAFIANFAYNIQALKEKVELNIDDFQATKMDVADAELGIDEASESDSDFYQSNVKDALTQEQKKFDTFKSMLDYMRKSYEALIINSWLQFATSAVGLTQSALTINFAVLDIIKMAMVSGPVGSGFGSAMRAKQCLALRKSQNKGAKSAIPGIGFVPLPGAGSEASERAKPSLTAPARLVETIKPSSDFIIYMGKWSFKAIVKNFIINYITSNSLKLARKTSKILIPEAHATLPLFRVEKSYDQLVQELEALKRNPLSSDLDRAKLEWDILRHADNPRIPSELEQARAYERFLVLTGNENFDEVARAKQRSIDLDSDFTDFEKIYAEKLDLLVRNKMFSLDAEKVNELKQEILEQLQDLPETSENPETIRKRKILMAIDSIIDNMPGPTTDGKYFFNKRNEKMIQLANEAFSEIRTAKDERLQDKENERIRIEEERRVREQGVVLAEQEAERFLGVELDREIELIQKKITTIENEITAAEAQLKRLNPSYETLRVVLVEEIKSLNARLDLARVEVEYIDAFKNQKKQPGKYSEAIIQLEAKRNVLRNAISSEVFTAALFLNEAEIRRDRASSILKSTIEGSPEYNAALAEAKTAKALVQIAIEAEKEADRSVVNVEREIKSFTERQEGIRSNTDGMRERAMLRASQQILQQDADTLENLKKISADVKGKADAVSAALLELRARQLEVARFSVAAGDDKTTPSPALRTAQEHLQVAETRVEEANKKYSKAIEQAKKQAELAKQVPSGRRNAETFLSVIDDIEFARQIETEIFADILEKTERIESAAAERDRAVEEFRDGVMAADDRESALAQTDEVKRGVRSTLEAELELTGQQREKFQAALKKSEEAINKLGGVSEQAAEAQGVLVERVERARSGLSQMPAPSEIARTQPATDGTGSTKGSSRTRRESFARLVDDYVAAESKAQESKADAQRSKELEAARKELRVQESDRTAHDQKISKIESRIRELEARIDNFKKQKLIDISIESSKEAFLSALEAELNTARAHLELAKAEGSVLNAKSGASSLDDAALLEARKELIQKRSALDVAIKAEVDAIKLLQENANERVQRTGDDTSTVADEIKTAKKTAADDFKAAADRRLAMAEAFQKEILDSNTDWDVAEQVRKAEAQVYRTDDAGVKARREAKDLEARAAKIESEAEVLRKAILATMDASVAARATKDATVAYMKAIQDTRTLDIKYKALIKRDIKDTVLESQLETAREKQRIANAEFEKEVADFVEKMQQAEQVASKAEKHPKGQQLSTEINQTLSSLKSSHSAFVDFHTVAESSKLQAQISAAESLINRSSIEIKRDDKRYRQILTEEATASGEKKVALKQEKSDLLKRLEQERKAKEQYERAIESYRTKLAAHKTTVGLPDEVDSAFDEAIENTKSRGSSFLVHDDTVQEAKKLRERAATLITRAKEEETMQRSAIDDLKEQTSKAQRGTQELSGAQKATSERIEELAAAEGKATTSQQASEQQDVISGQESERAGLITDEFTDLASIQREFASELESIKEREAAERAARVALDSTESAARSDAEGAEAEARAELSALLSRGKDDILEAQRLEAERLEEESRQKAADQARARAELIQDAQTIGDDIKNDLAIEVKERLDLKKLEIEARRHIQEREIANAEAKARIALDVIHEQLQKDQADLEAQKIIKRRKLEARNRTALLKTQAAIQKSLISKTLERKRKKIADAKARRERLKAEAAAKAREDARVFASFMENEAKARGEMIAKAISEAGALALEMDATAAKKTTEAEEAAALKSIEGQARKAQAKAQAKASLRVSAERLTAQESAARDALIESAAIEARELAERMGEELAQAEEQARTRKKEQAEAFARAQAEAKAKAQAEAAAAKAAAAAQAQREAEALARAEEEARARAAALAEAKAAEAERARRKRAGRGIRPPMAPYGLTFATTEAEAMELMRAALRRQEQTAPQVRSGAAATADIGQVISAHEDALDAWKSLFASTESGTGLKARASQFIRQIEANIDYHSTVAEGYEEARGNPAKMAVLERDAQIAMIEGEMNRAIEASRAEMARIGEPSTAADLDTLVRVEKHLNQQLDAQRRFQQARATASDIKTLLSLGKQFRRLQEAGERQLADGSVRALSPRETMEEAIKRAKQAAKLADTTESLEKSGRLENLRSKSVTAAVAPGSTGAPGAPETAAAAARVLSVSEQRQRAADRAQEAREAAMAYVQDQVDSIGGTDQEAIEQTMKEADRAFQVAANEEAHRVRQSYMAAEADDASGGGSSGARADFAGKGSSELRRMAVILEGGEQAWKGLSPAQQAQKVGEMARLRFHAQNAQDQADMARQRVETMRANVNMTDIESIRTFETAERYAEGKEAHAKNLKKKWGLLSTNPSEAQAREFRVAQAEFNSARDGSSFGRRTFAGDTRITAFEPEDLDNRPVGVNAQMGMNVGLGIANIIFSTTLEILKCKEYEKKNMYSEYQKCRDQALAAMAEGGFFTILPLLVMLFGPQQNLITLLFASPWGRIALNVVMSGIDIYFMVILEESIDLYERRESILGHTLEVWENRVEGKRESTSIDLRGRTTGAEKLVAWRAANGALEKVILQELKKNFGVGGLASMKDFRVGHLDQMKKHVEAAAVKSPVGAGSGFNLEGAKKFLSLKTVRDLLMAPAQAQVEDHIEAYVEPARANKPSAEAEAYKPGEYPLMTATDFCVDKNRKLSIGCACRKNNSCFKLGKKFVPKHFQKHKEVKAMARLYKRITHGEIDPKTENYESLLKVVLDFSKRAQSLNNKALKVMEERMKTSKKAGLRSKYKKARRGLPLLSERIWNEHLQLDDYPEANHKFLGNMMNYNKAIKRALVSKGRAGQVANYLPNYKAMGSGMVDSMFDFEGAASGAAVDTKGHNIFRKLSVSGGAGGGSAFGVPLGAGFKDEIIESLKGMNAGRGARVMAKADAGARSAEEPKENWVGDEYEIDSISKRKGHDIFGLISRRYLMKRKGLR